VIIKSVYIAGGGYYYFFGRQLLVASSEGGPYPPFEFITLNITPCSSGYCTAQAGLWGCGQPGVDAMICYFLSAGENAVVFHLVCESSCPGKFLVQGESGGKYFAPFISAPRQYGSA